MNDHFADVVTWAVSRFWSCIKDDSTLRDEAVEASLIEIAAQRSVRNSKLWAAVLIVSAFDSAEAEEEVVSVLRSLSGKVACPPKSMLRLVGMTLSGGCVIPASATLTRTSASPDRALAILQGIDGLNYQSVAEIVLALIGSKVSRLTIAGEMALRLSVLLDYPAVIGSLSYSSIEDSQIGRFSNIAKSNGLIADVRTESAVFAYFGGTIEDRFIVAALDKFNLAGRFLGIPQCCRARFMQAWGHAIEHHEGDIGFMQFMPYLDASSLAEISLPWQCNPYGMYQGGGLIWHFPCSLECAETISIANKRYWLLSKLDIEFADLGARHQSRSFWLSRDRSFSFEPMTSRQLHICPIEMVNKN